MLLCVLASGHNTILWCSRMGIWRIIEDLDVDVAQGRMTPTEMLQTGLETTLNTSEIIKKDNRSKR